MRTIDWIPGEEAGPGHIRMIDQTRLPGDTVVLDIHTVDDLVDAIARLSVRGAPALGVAGAMGVVIAAQQFDEPARAEQAAAQIRAARPTAVNLSVGVDRALAAWRTGGVPTALEAALDLRDEDIAACRAMAALGADLVRSLAARNPHSRAAGLTTMTICNTGALAAVEHGTALGVIEKLYQDGDLALAIACETRPLLQGARLTTWELAAMGAPHQLIVDSAAAMILAGGGVDAVLVGADRIAANGDTANKIGTFALAVAARYAGVPFIVVAPESTVDRATATGSDIEIEDRGAGEVVGFGTITTAPAGTPARNPAFDVTPAALITALVTERRVIRPLDGDRPDKATPHD
ncbi:methylthioribose-1-phosphate isomerase [Nakamurella sp. UYEF19]|uniref:S-methyl-5-thioribose-1-phosphate isomerase n=1 Tax=Nakamurella sp. UYEF19 TaxID=1756392 RepID=UPI003391D7C6